MEAFNITREARWVETARACLDWFLGRNDQRLPLYDPATGGCRDGLHSEGVNQNQGAESTLAWLMSLLTLRVRVSEVISESVKSRPTASRSSRRKS